MYVCMCACMCVCYEMSDALRYVCMLRYLCYGCMNACMCVVRCVPYAVYHMHAAHACDTHACDTHACACVWDACVCVCVGRMRSYACVRVRVRARVRECVRVCVRTASRHGTRGARPRAHRIAPPPRHTAPSTRRRPAPARATPRPAARPRDGGTGRTAQHASLHGLTAGAHPLLVCPAAPSMGRTARS